MAPLHTLRKKKESKISDSAYHGAGNVGGHGLEEREAGRVSGQHRVNGEEKGANRGAKTSAQAAQHHVLLAAVAGATLTTAHVSWNYKYIHGFSCFSWKTLT